MTRSRTCEAGQNPGPEADSGAVSSTLARPAVHIKTGTVEEIRRLGESLLRAHAEEAEPGMAAKLDPDWAAYELLEKAGRLIVLCAWGGQNYDELAGYAVATLFRHPHYDTLVCQHDVLYLKPEWRNRGQGDRLFSTLHGHAQARGAGVLLMHAKQGSRLESILFRKGFVVEETVFKETL